MAKTRFEVAIQRVPLGETGQDDVEFLIAPNIGEGLRPLSKVASGGELSRVMLAIKSVLADRENTETLIFDEVDTGISGRTSYRLGMMLCRIADVGQVLCITHAAQIAALAQNHLLISKHERDGRTETSVEALDDERRVGEIARIMGGNSITESLYRTAREMLEDARRPRA